MWIAFRINYMALYGLGAVVQSNWHSGKSLKGEKIKAERNPEKSSYSCDIYGAF